MRRTPALATVRLAMLHNLFILSRTLMLIGVWEEPRLSPHRIIIWKIFPHSRPLHHRLTIHHIPTIPPSRLFPTLSRCSVMKIQMGAKSCEARLGGAVRELWFMEEKA
jgi:hypothetical protein